ncbi:terpene synthase family protein [Actinomadura sp. DC4]|uniref:terpene synthase family protein n=1 Tax=Actinomadura sp. DC4 TaxID=3055069 RepID=UPI0025B1F41A|nr:terpene synthase family protein [Actinomadura sp. DC4]MDN3351098.1 terpene synthase family protein [Actinomadura sp. DC4]
MAYSVARQDDPGDVLDTAAERGRACALAMECLRDLQECAAEYPGLFAAKPFGPTVFSGVALANAFGSPRSTAAGIRVAARTSLWAFAADWLMDYVATSREEIDAIVGGCAAVGDGAEPDPGAPVQGLLASLRDELATRPAWAAQRPVWRDHLQRYLLANAREWSWKTDGDAAPPTLEDYLANADNFGSSLVNVGHWIYNGAASTPSELRLLAAASAEVQRTLRLLNDLATYERDLAWGDLNSLMLGATRDDVDRRIGELADGCEKLIAPLAADFPGEADYLRRQIGHSAGYYGMTDYWGAL